MVGPRTRGLQAARGAGGGMLDELEGSVTRSSVPPRAGVGMRPALVAALAVVAALAYLYAGGAATPPTGAAAGRRPLATDFSAPSFSGQELRLADFGGQPVVLNFWASWCPPCRAEARDLERAWQAYRERGVVFLGVDIQDSEPEARVFLHEFGVTYPNILDAANEIAVTYGISGIPTTIFIDRDGRIAGHRVGPLSEQQLVARVEELLR
jgi:cytochrome c biogenesis protein CcmG, thiol:disulfide interchange protein DsbE